MTRALTAWLRFFRIVNLPTVPGDLFAGAASVLTFAPAAASGALAKVAVAVAASCCLYLYGLADNDIVGAPTDRGRPIPDGALSLRAARLARVLCWAGAVASGLLGALPLCWWAAAGGLLLAILAYNRTKSAALMGLCRGLNVLCGGACVAGPTVAALLPAGLWTLYIAGVTRSSEGEETDPAKKARVGFLIGALVYLQLAVLLAAAVCRPLPEIRRLLVAGAMMLVLTRLFRHAFPKVSAS